MKAILVIVLLLVATALFIAAGFLGAVPPAARLNNWGLACMAAAGLVYVAPI